MRGMNERKRREGTKERRRKLPKPVPTFLEKE